MECPSVQVYASVIRAKLSHIAVFLALPDAKKRNILADFVNPQNMINRYNASIDTKRLAECKNERCYMTKTSKELCMKCWCNHTSEYNGQPNTLHYILRCLFEMEEMHTYFQQLKTVTVEDIDICLEMLYAATRYEKTKKITITIYNILEKAIKFNS